MERDLIFNALATVNEAFFNGSKSGFLKLSIGVGTVIIKISAFAIDSTLLVKSAKFAFKSSPFPISLVLSKPFFKFLSLSVLISNPITFLLRIFPYLLHFCFLENSIAKGKPTYPNPMIAIVHSF